MRERIFETIAAKLADRIASDPKFVLPRIVDMAEEFGVSYPTLWKAMQILVGKGLVVSLGGRRLAVARVDGSTPAISSDGPVDRLHATLRDRILNGAYRSGQPFLKAGYFVASEDVSYLTVTRAFARLASENLAHRRCKRWFVGPRPAAQSSRPRLGQDRPAIIAVVEKTTTWGASLADEFSNRFLEPFVRECADRGLEVVPCLLSSDLAGMAAVPTGSRAISDKARELGDRYRGTLVRRTHADFFPDIARLMKDLSRRSMPVIYFDSTNEGATLLTRPALGLGRQFFRMHLDDFAAVRLALGELSYRGHRRVGVHGAEIADWCQRRTELIERCAATFDPPMEVVVAQPAEKFWSASLDRSSENVVQRIARSDNMPLDADHSLVQIRGIRDLLIQRAPSMTALLAEHAVTALVALNDWMAWNQYAWLWSVGIDIPRHVSIVSFDNIAPTSLLPISSVDWGFSRLAYLAAHIFVGDIPVSADRKGGIAGVCTISGSSTIGAPGDPSEVARLLRG